MKTYLTLWFNSDGTRPTEVLEKLEEVGMEPVKGNYDMQYKWDEKPSTEEVLQLGDMIRKKLKGDHVLFKMETV